MTTRMFDILDFFANGTQYKMYKIKLNWTTVTCKENNLCPFPILKLMEVLVHKFKYVDAVHPEAVVQPRVKIR